MQKYFLTIDVSHSFKNNRCCRPRMDQPRLLFDKYLSNSYIIKITPQIYKIENSKHLISKMNDMKSHEIPQLYETGISSQALYLYHTSKSYFYGYL